MNGYQILELDMKHSVLLDTSFFVHLLNDEDPLRRKKRIISSIYKIIATYQQSTPKRLTWQAGQNGHLLTSFIC